MTFNEKRARRVFEIKTAQIRTLEDQIKELKEEREVAKDFLISIHGSCEECQNSHWPKCHEA